MTRNCWILPILLVAMVTLAVLRLANPPGAVKPSDSNTIMVLVAINDLPEGTVLARPGEMLRRKEFARGPILAEQPIHDLESIRGKVLQNRLLKDQVLMPFDIGPAVEIPDGWFTLNIRCAFEGHPDLVLPGTYVSLVDARPPRLFIEKTLVVRASTRPVPSIAESIGNFVKIMTVAVAPTDGEKLKLRMTQKGKDTIFGALIRKPGDEPDGN